MHIGVALIVLSGQVVVAFYVPNVCSMSTYRGSAASERDKKAVTRQSHKYFFVSPMSLRPYGEGFSPTNSKLL